MHFMFICLYLCIYSGLSICWVITASATDVYIKLTIEDTAMESNLFCIDGDFVEVKDGT